MPIQNREKRHFSKRLGLVLALLEPLTVGRGLVLTAAVTAATLFRPATAEAQTAWGVGRRSGRRAARRTTRRQNYLYSVPAGAVAVPVGGVTYYEVEGVRYQPQMIEGQVVYVPVG